MKVPPSLTVCSALFAATSVLAQTVHLVDAFPTKARYAPGEAVKVIVQTSGTVTSETLAATILDLGKSVGKCDPVSAATRANVAVLSCTPPAGDFHGYMIDIALKSGDTTLEHRDTAIDISSDWKRFPRYGYLAHYNMKEGAQPAEWISELNKFHINGLQFYDFQYRHDQPLAGTPSAPARSWPEISMREVDRDIVLAFIQQAHQRNMMAMAYNASYSGYDDVFTRPNNPLPISFAVWSDAASPRTPDTVKSLPMPAGWATSRLLYMNQNDAGWQKYIYSQMNQLFEAYPFDGWHIDTFGERSAYSKNGNLVDFIEGMPEFIDHAHDALGKRVVMNAVATRGQERNAKTKADFVYSELWELNETYGTIQKAVQQVKKANPDMSMVMAAYVNRDAKGQSNTFGKTEFDTPAVLLTDAAIFASGASHIELGDGGRMLASEYFPNDKLLAVSPELHDRLRTYYDVLTGYEDYLQDAADTKDVTATVTGYETSTTGAAKKIWLIAREAHGVQVVHLVNLTASADGKWRDSTISMRAPETFKALPLQIAVGGPVTSVGYVAPDLDGGDFHSLAFHQQTDSGKTKIDLILPSLQYWSFIVIKH